jgi:ankyrin repeat protein
VPQTLDVGHPRSLLQGFALAFLRHKSDELYVAPPNQPAISIRKSRALRLRIHSIIIFCFCAVSLSAGGANVQELNTALVDAATKGDLSAVTRLLDEGADPNASITREQVSRTALNEAVYHNRLEIVKALLDRGADPRSGGYSVLDSALDKKHEAVVRLLLAHGVSVNDRGSDGETSLYGHFTYSPLRINEIEFLLDLGADPNLANNKGITPLMRAAHTFISDHKQPASSGIAKELNEQGPALAKAIGLLLKHGADVNARDENGRTPLYYAAEEGSIIAIKALVAAGADVNAQTKEGDCPLLRVLRRNDRDGRIEYLIGHGADLKARDNDGQTALMFAIAAGYRKQAELCLQRGVDPNARTKRGTTAAHCAGQFFSQETWLGRYAVPDVEGRRGAVEMLRLLAAYRADFAAADLEGETALHAAARNGYVESLQFLADQGGDLNKRNKKEETPLFLSIPSNLDAFAKTKLLLAKGAEINAPGPAGKTPLMLAADLMVRGQIVQLLQQHADANAVDAHGETALARAASSSGDRFVESCHYIAVIRELAKTTTPVDRRDARGMTALIWTAISNNPEAVTALLDKGADINGRSADGRTPLMWAASANARETMAILISRGADAEAKDNDGRTALAWAKVLDETIPSLPAGQLK